MSNNSDLNNLKLLAIFHYIIGGLGVLIALVPLIYLAIGIMILVTPEALTEASSGEIPPVFAGYLFAAIGGVCFIVGQALAIMIIYSGIQLQKQKKYLFSFIIACVLCAFFPFGTVLGVFTILALTKDSVKKLYEEKAQG